MKRHFKLILNIALILFVSIFQDLYIKEGSIAFKSLASIGFVLLGTLNLIFAIKNKSIKLKFSIIMVIGLFFAMLGDILLEIEFLVGAIFFAVGHVLFFISYCFVEKFKWIDLIAGAILAVSSTLVIILVPVFDFGSSTMEVLIILYAVIISLMLGKAITNFIRNRNLLNLIILIGSILFFFSDFMLLLDWFMDAGRNISLLCMVAYYPAECLLGHSIFAYVQRKQI